MQFRNFLLTICFLSFLTISTSAQGDVRSATGMPIPIGAPVIWGQIEIKGLRPDEPKPSIYVSLMFNGAQMARAQANDKGYYYFLQRARDGAALLVTVGGIDIGSQVISAAGGDRYDMTVNWTESLVARQRTGVVSVNQLYPERSAANSALFDKGIAASKNKKPDDSIKLFKQVLDSDPNDFVAWTELGTVYFGQSKHSDAENAYKRAMNLKPDFLVATLNLGKLYLAIQKPQDAIPVLEKALSTDPKSPDVNHYLGEAYLQTRQGSKAVGFLNEAITLDPVGKAEIHLRLAALYNAAGLKDRAVLEYKMFLEKTPDYPERQKLEKYIKDNG